MSGKLFVVSACSGAGKTTLVSQVITRLAGEYPLSRVITYTSKKPRLEEVDGRDYHFLSPEEFEEKINDNYFLEWSGEYGNYYGSPSSIIEGLKAGNNFIIITDIQGAVSINKKIQSSVFIWIEVPAQETIKTRLLMRNSENNEQIQERISISFRENEKFLKSLLFNYRVLNEDIEKAVLELESIIKLELKKSII